MGNRSTDRLVAALEAAGAPSELVDKARSEKFHDFLSDSGTPKIDLVLACEHAGLRVVAAAAKNGEFDATREESDQWMNSEDGQRCLRKLASGK